MTPEKEPLIIQYANLLSAHGEPNAPEVIAFRAQHKADKVFAKRAKQLDALFVLAKVSRPLYPALEGPLVLQYTKLLLTYGDHDAEPVVAFRQAHRSDVAFLKRAQKLDKLLQLSNELDGGSEVTR